GLVRARVRGPVFAGGAHRPEPRSTALVHIVFAVAWRPGALDLVSLRAGVRLGGGEVASRRAAPAAAARHPAEHSGARFSPRARARLDVAVPDPPRGARARGHPYDLPGAGVDPGALGRKCGARRGTLWSRACEVR